jgi:nucleoid-associated protein YgaU
MFFDGSRYQRIADAELIDGEGKRRSLKRTREAATTELAMTYQVREGDRLDLLANQFFHDPRKWWLIADANPDALTLEELLVPGRLLRIPKNRAP